MPYKQYTDAQKIAYYRKKAAEGTRSYRSYSNRPAKRVTKRKSYPAKRNYRKLDYPGAGAAIGSALGTLVGGPTGTVMGAGIGTAAQQLVKSVTGFGDYQIKANSLLYNVDAVPEFTSMNPNCTMVCHREYICDIQTGPNLSGTTSGTTNFDVTSFRINPADPNTFPWLSSMARNYEQYVVQGMIFEFKSNSATAVSSTNTALGSVILATQYNSLSPEFINKQQMEAHQFASSTIPSQNVMHAIECDPHQTQCGGIFNTIDPGATPGDKRLYDLGTFSIATKGMQAPNVDIGELWVTYKICFLKPQLMSPIGLYDHYDFNVASVVASSYSPYGNLSLATEASTNSGISLLSKDTSGVCYIDIDETYIGLLGISFSVGDGASTARVPNFLPVSGVANIVPLNMFHNQGGTVAATGYIAVNYNAGSSDASGRGGQTFSVYQCLGGPGMRLYASNANITNADAFYNVNSVSMDVFSIGIGRLGPPVPFGLPLASNSVSPNPSFTTLTVNEEPIVELQEQDDGLDDDDMVYLPSKGQFYDAKTDKLVKKTFNGSRPGSANRPI